MLRGSEFRKADHPIHPLFLDRWSPRELSGDPIPEADLRSLFEAARWAPSSYNAQPWRFVYALRGGERWSAFLDLLVDSNREWAKDAGALFVLVSRKRFERNDRPSRTHSFDAGAAWENLALQGAQLGYAVHGMEGFDYERARDVVGIPAHYQVEMMAAVGIARDRGELDPARRESERPNGRKPLDEICFAEAFPADAT